MQWMSKFQKAVDEVQAGFDALQQGKVGQCIDRLQRAQHEVGDRYWQGEIVQAVEAVRDLADAADFVVEDLLDALQAQEDVFACI